MRASSRSSGACGLKIKDLAVAMGRKGGSASRIYGHAFSRRREALTFAARAQQVLAALASAPPAALTRRPGRRAAQQVPTRPPEGTLATTTETYECYVIPVTYWSLLSEVVKRDGRRATSGGSTHRTYLAPIFVNNAGRGT